MMKNLLEAAGFLAVEAEGDSLWARLSANGPEFRADPEAGAYILTLMWPVRLDGATIAAWSAQNPSAILDIFGGETRLRMAAEAAADLAMWRAAAESMIQACVVFRRAQRARGEGF